MTEGYLYEKDAGETEITWRDPKTKEKKKATAAGIIKKGEKHPAYKDAKAAMDGDDKDDKPDTKKGMDIDTTGGLGGDDEEKPSGDEPEGEPSGEEPSGEELDAMSQEEYDKWENARDRKVAKEKHPKLYKIAKAQADAQREKERLEQELQQKRNDGELKDPYYVDERDFENGKEGWKENERKWNEHQQKIRDAEQKWEEADQAAYDYKKENPSYEDDLPYDHWGMFEDYEEEQGRTGTEEIKVINGKKYHAIKESVDKRISVKEVHKWLKGLEEYRYRKIPGVDARRITSFVNNGLSETDLSASLQKKWGNAKYSREKHLADKFVKERISRKLARNESNHPLKEQYNKLFKNKVVL